MGACASANGSNSGLIDAEALQKLANSVGRVLTPADGNTFDVALRGCWNASLAQKKPACIVSVQDAFGVAACITFAKQHGLTVCTLSVGSHNPFAVVDGAMVIDLSNMRKISISKKDMTISVQAGLQNQAVDTASSEVGMTAALGWISHENMVESMLNGGEGWLARSRGLNCDSIIEFEMVDAAGEIRTVDKSKDPELFWALCGGSTNFGVVTKVKLSTTKANKALSGLLLYSFDKAREALLHFQKVCEELSGDLNFSCKATLGYGPRNLPIIAFLVFYSVGPEVGSEKKAEDAVAKLRAFGTPDVDTVNLDTHLSSQKLFDHTNPPGHKYYEQAPYLSKLSSETIDSVISAFGTLPECALPLSSVIFSLRGGKIATGTSAAPHRAAPFALNVRAVWESATEKKVDSTMIKWARKCAAAASADTVGHATATFYPGDSENTYGESLDRLQRVKGVVDPHNFFCNNNNITPKKK